MPGGRHTGHRDKHVYSTAALQQLRALTETDRNKCNAELHIVREYSREEFLKQYQESLFSSEFEGDPRRW